MAHFAGKWVVTRTDSYGTRPNTDLRKTFLIFSLHFKKAIQFCLAIPDMPDELDGFKFAHVPEIFQSTNSLFREMFEQTIFVFEDIIIQLLMKKPSITPEQMTRRCQVCNHRLIGRGKYCGECGSKVWSGIEGRISVFEKWPLIKCLFVSQALYGLHFWLHFCGCI